MKPFLLLLKKDIKELLFSKTAFLLLLILSLINGYSFYNAVTLYSNASITAIDNPLYAAGFEPCQGVFVPAFGGVFVLLSLFLPFIIIPLIINEKERNTLTVLLQIPFRITQIIISKFIASAILLIIIFFLFIPGTVIWIISGGHIPVMELFLLASGYFLYGTLIITISLFSAALFKNSSSASIFAIFTITLSWIIDFAKDMDISPALTILAKWTTTAQLHYFENGVFASSAFIYFILLSLLFMILTYIFLKYEFRTRDLLPLTAVSVILPTAIYLINFNRDVTESRRNSFPEALTSAIEKLPPLRIDVFLHKNDSRFKDYDNNFLQRLKLTKSDITVKMVEGKELEQNYGLFKYETAGHSGSTYSNSEEEIFPLIFRLAGIEEYNLSDTNRYKGFPLVIQDRSRISMLYYTYLLFIPLLLCILYFYRVVKKRYLNKRAEQ